MIPHSARLCLLALAAFFGFSATPWPALAISCDFTLTDLEFGVYDQVSGAPTDSTAVIVLSGHGVSRLGGQHKKRWVALQGVGEGQDERSAEWSCCKLDRPRGLIVVNCLGLGERACRGST